MTDQPEPEFADGETTDLYILNKEKKPVPVPESDLLRWGQWMETALRSGRRTVATSEVEDFRIATLFTGCDSNWGDGPPVLFESKVTEAGERRDIYSRRYPTWSEAEDGHKAVCDQMRDLAAKRQA